jgi:hypothetical protein
VGKKQVFEVKTAGGNRDKREEYYSSAAQFRIKVEAAIESTFYLKVSKRRVAEAVFEGLPASFQLAASMPLPLQFINGQDLSQPLSLMVNIEDFSLSLTPPALDFQVSAEDQNGTSISNASSLLLLMTPSGRGTYSLSLQNFKGTYYITISSKATLNITVILFDSNLTHLVPFDNHFFDKEGVYQLFTNSQNVLVEVFNCQGDFELIASKDYKDMKASDGQVSPIALRRPNYAGHYVLGIEGIFGSYYMRVNSKTPGATA